MPDDKVIDIKEIEYHFRALLTELTEFERLTVTILTSTDAVDKYRVYTNIAAPSKLCKRIAEALRSRVVKHNIDPLCIDLAPYSGHLRLPMSYKVDQTKKSIAMRYYKVSSYDEF